MYAPLAVTSAQIYQEVLTTEFCDIPKPLIIKTKNPKDPTNYCEFHKGYRHLTDECIQLRDTIK